MYRFLLYLIAGWSGFLVMAIGRIVPRKPVRRLEWVYAWAA